MLFNGCDLNLRKGVKCLIGSTFLYFIRTGYVFLSVYFRRLHLISLINEDVLIILKYKFDFEIIDLANDVLYLSFRFNLLMTDLVFIHGM